METPYVIMIAQTWRDMIALNAAAEPMLMIERRQVMMQVSAIAFAGISFPGSTCEIQREKGRPRSRANANV